MNVGKRSFSITRVESVGDREAVAAFLYDIYVKECKWTYFGKNNPAGLRVSTEGLNYIYDIPNASRTGDTNNYLWDEDSFTSCPWAHTFVFRDVHTDKIVGTARLTERCPRRFKLPTELYNLPPSVREAIAKADVEMSRLAVHSAYRGGLLLPIIYQYFFGLYNHARLTIMATVMQHNAMRNFRNMIQLLPAFHARDSSGNVLTFKYEPQDPHEVDVLFITGPVMRAAFSDYSAKLLLSRETAETNRDIRDKIMSR